MASFSAQNNQPFTVLVEGNIGKSNYLLNFRLNLINDSSGSGKTTFLNHFAKFQDSICLMTEPVDNWRNLKVS